MPVETRARTMTVAAVPGQHYQSIDSTPLAVRDALADLRAAFPLSDDEADRVEIAIAEVLNNVVEHAYANEPDHTVELWATLQGATLTVDVQDTGRTMPNNALPSGTRADISGPVETMPEGGFGWFLIHTLASDIAYSHHGGRNSLTVQFELST